MRKSVSEGRKREFARLAQKEVPDPEDLSSFQSSKLIWSEHNEGKHSEMLDWVKALILVRKAHVCLNDGDMHHVMVSTDDARRTLVMQREEARVLLNLGEETQIFRLLHGENLELISRSGIAAVDGELSLPPMTLAVLMSSRQAVEDREVSHHDVV